MVAHSCHQEGVCVTVSLGAGELQQLLVPVEAFPVPSLATRELKGTEKIALESFVLTAGWQVLCAHTPSLREILLNSGS